MKFFNVKACRSIILHLHEPVAAEQERNKVFDDVKFQGVKTCSVQKKGHASDRQTAILVVLEMVVTLMPGFDVAH